MQFKPIVIAAGPGACTLAGMQQRGRLSLSKLEATITDMGECHPC